MYLCIIAVKICIGDVCLIVTAMIALHGVVSLNSKHLKPFRWLCNVGIGFWTVTVALGLLVLLIATIAPQVFFKDRVRLLFKNILIHIIIIFEYCNAMFSVFAVGISIQRTHRLQWRLCCAVFGECLRIFLII